MTYTAAHNVLTLFGTFTSEQEPEVWQMTLRLAEGQGLPQGSADPAVLDLVNDDVEADLHTWWTAMASNFSASVKFLGFKLNGVDTNGHYIDQERTNVRDFATPKVGTAGASLPPQCAIAVTFHTAAARGLAAKGRVYLPPPSMAIVSEGGRLADSARDQITLHMATLLTNLSDWPGIDAAADPGRVCVMSKVGAGATRRVNGVSIGDRFDVQRRRANRLREHRSAVAPVVS